MIIETDPPLLRILVVWGGVNNQETTLLDDTVDFPLYLHGCMATITQAV